MNNEIKDMAEIIAVAHNNNQEKIYGELKGDVIRESKNPPVAIAEALYAAGYRKQSDTVKEFVEKLIEIIKSLECYCDNDYDEGNNDAIQNSLTEIIALAKEYGAEVKK